MVFSFKIHIWKKQGIFSGSDFFDISFPVTPISLPAFFLPYSEDEEEVVSMDHTQGFVWLHFNKPLTFTSDNPQFPIPEENGGRNLRLQKWLLRGRSWTRDPVSQCQNCAGVCSTQS